VKIAIAMFGIPRCSSVTMPSLEENIFAPAREMGDVGIFYHLYRQDTVRNPRSNEDAALDASNYEPFTAFTGETSAPDAAFEAFDLSSLHAFGDEYKDEWRSTRNLILQLHSLDRVTALAGEWDPDVLVFARPDLLYHDRMEGAFLRFAAGNGRACVIPCWQWWGGYNDRFAICGRQIYRPYGGRLAEALSFCRARKRPLHAESLLRYVLRRSRAVLASTRLRATRVRVGGRLADEIFLARKALGDRRLVPEMALCLLRGRLLKLAFRGAATSRRGDPRAPSSRPGRGASPPRPRASTRAPSAPRP
jgi:hypothetical protein